MWIFCIFPDEMCICNGGYDKLEIFTIFSMFYGSAGIQIWPKVYIINSLDLYTFKNNFVATFPERVISLFLRLGSIFKLYEVYSKKFY